MKKTPFAGILIAALAGASWHYASPQTREALLGFIGLASRRDAGEIRRAIGDAVLPDDPIARRAVLAEGLKRSIRELQRRTITDEQGTEAAAAAGFVPDKELAGKTTADILAGAGNAITELEGANKDESAGTKITERILERILPAAQCKE